MKKSWLLIIFEKLITSKINKYLKVTIVYVEEKTGFGFGFGFSPIPLILFPSKHLKHPLINVNDQLLSLLSEFALIPIT